MTVARTVPFPHPGGLDVLVIHTMHIPATGPEAAGPRLSALGLVHAETPYRAGNRVAPFSAGVLGFLPYGVPARMLAHPPVLPVQAPHLASALPPVRPVVLR